MYFYTKNYIKTSFLRIGLSCVGAGYRQQYFIQGVASLCPGLSFIGINSFNFPLLRKLSK